MIRILHTNDMHGRLDERRFRLLSAVRDDADLYFDTGDAIKTGNLGIPLGEDPVWNQLAQLRCTASVLGNRETHILRSAFLGKIAGARHPILCANLRDKWGDRPLPGSIVVEFGGFKIGLVAVMVPMVTERMRTRAASAYLWDDPIKTAIEHGSTLRESVDLLFALTHIGLTQDRKLAEVRLYDLILGGHSHDLLADPDVGSGTPILQAGSHARVAGRYDWEPGKGLVRCELVSLTST